MPLGPDGSSVITPLHYRKREDEVNQSSQRPIYGELHSMSFIQLFQLCVAIAQWKWDRNTEISMVVKRAEKCDRRRRLQPAYAAVLLHDSGVARNAQRTGRQ